MAEHILSLRQVEEACPSCGSFYRRGDTCNICGAFAPVAQPGHQRTFREGKAPHGRTWLKAQRRYLRQGEAIPV